MNFLGNADHPITLLVFMTFAAALIVAGWMLISLLKKRKHRHPMQGQRERNIDEIREEGGDPGRPE